MKVYITKYALTKGITETEAKEFNDIPGMVRAKDGTFFHGEGKEWHRTREEAVKRAEEMKMQKIDSLKDRLPCLRINDLYDKREGE